MSRASKSEFLRALSAKRHLFFDGGLGTMLQARGLPSGMSPELFCLERSDVLLGIHKDYASAGADVITTNTFGGNGYKLPAQLDVRKFNRKMALLAREAADNSGRQVFVAGSVGPTGHFLRPLGEIIFNDLVEVYAEQIRGLVEGSADLIQIETQIDIAEARAAVVAARRVCDLPISVSMTYEQGVTLTGSNPEVCTATLANLGVDIIATNCSAGPEQLRKVVECLVAVSPVPVLVQPNAGLPELIDGKTVFRLAPDPFARLTAEFAVMGARLLGGCCGTTPEHIAVLRKAVEGMEVIDTTPYSLEGHISLTTRSELVRIGEGYPFRLIGERINPTGKKQLSAELAAGELTEALRFASEQIAAGAQILDVNVGAPMVDEVATLPLLVESLTARCQTPLSLDSSNAAAIQAALDMCPASPLVNSISGEPGRMEHLGPLCRDYGAPFILLPLKGRKLPVTAEERIEIVEALLEKMQELVIPRHLALVDALVLSVSAKPEAARECIKFVRYCTDTLKLPTVSGLSNISFGLPARELINAHFLTLGAGVGLSSSIANPGSRYISEAVAAVNLLMEHDKDAIYFIDNYGHWSSGSGGVAPVGGQGAGEDAATGGKSGGVTLPEAVIAGLREEVLPLVERALERGIPPFEIVNEHLIPGITEVGAKYERKEYFLPQLLRSAETMQAAFARLKPLLEADSRSGERHKVIMATVEGDIHDIGKNIVSLMLGNHGFEVIDLGKDVKAGDIVAASKYHKAKLIGLSALMTTTMVRMEDTIKLLKEQGLDDIKVMVGGAVITPDFARSIGAHGVSKDAVEAVRVAKILLGD